jgi:tetratricopeptide (TPR) repeat protein
LLADARELAGAEGELLHGRYRVLRELGRGGMGIVYAAEDTALARRVALKRLSFAAGLGPGLAEQALREARAAARLDHPNIAAVYDAYPDALVLQLVEGPSLAELARPPLGELVGWIRDAARAVQHAHEHGIVHRDLKPHNLLVAGGRVFVTDFGLAKELATAGAHSLSGSVLGTPSYMPPEQASGLAREVDARSDVYALGATLYDKLAGRPPFVAGDVVALLRAVVEDEPPPLAALAPDVPRDLALVVAKCLEKDKARRYASAAALADDLERWLAGRPVEARAPSAGYRLAKFVRRHRALVAAASVVGVVLVGAALWNTAERRARGVTEAALALSDELDVLIENADFVERAETPISKSEELERGVARCRDFLAAHPGAIALRVKMGMLLRGLGRRDEALGEFERALALAPEDGHARLERGLLLASKERAGNGGADAAELAARATTDLVFARAHPAGLRRLDLARAEAELLRLEGKLDEAQRKYAELARIAPDAEAPPALAALALAQGDPDEAFRQALSTLDLQRGFAPAYAAERAPAAPEEVLAAAIRQHARSADGLVTIEGLAGRYTDWDARLAEKKSTAAAHAQRALGELRRAARLEREGRAEEALVALEHASQSLGFATTIAPELAEAHLDLAEVELERARLLRALARIDAAEAAMARADLAAGKGRSAGASAVRLRDLEVRIGTAPTPAETR